MDGLSRSIRFAGRGVASLALLALLVACDRGRGASEDAAPPESSAPALAAWPAFPTGDAKSTIDAATRRPIPTRIGGGLDTASVLKAAIERGSAVAGWNAIDAWIGARVKASDGAGRSHWVLWGTRHDSALPIDAFRRLIAPTSSVAWTRAGVEQLRADGHWIGVAPEEQKGDDASIALWQLNGARSGLDEIIASQKRDDYAAWKLGYIDSVVDLVIAARATNRPVAGCDMPVPLQKRATADAENMLRLRELHCALATKRHLEQVKPPHHIAMLWGENHVGPDGFMRFLDPDIDVTAIRVATKVEGFDVIDPILVPPSSPDADALVVLADPNAARHLDRIRVKEKATESTFASAKPIEVRVDARAISVTTSPRAEKLDAGDHLLAIVRGDRTMVAALPLAKDESVTLKLEVVEPEITLTYAPAK